MTRRDVVWAPKERIRRGSWPQQEAPHVSSRCMAWLQSELTSTITGLSGLFAWDEKWQVVPQNVQPCFKASVQAMVTLSTEILHLQLLCRTV
jgi:hypothetical protein